MTYRDARGCLRNGWRPSIMRLPACVPGKEACRGAPSEFYHSLLRSMRHG